MTNDAHELVGCTINGWYVIEKREKENNETGGLFSVGYKVRDAKGNVAFLKALDYMSVMARSDDPAREQQSTVMPWIADVSFTDCSSGVYDARYSTNQRPSSSNR